VINEAYGWYLREARATNGEGLKAQMFKLGLIDDAGKHMKQNFPMAMHLDFVDLKLFVNIAETKSLTRAADRSHMCLSAASIRVRNIEDRLGAKLLNRTSNGVTLTLAGQTLLHHGRLLLQELDHLWSHWQDCRETPEQELRVAATATAVTGFLPVILRDFKSEHPNVRINLQECSPNEVVNSVRTELSDIGITAYGDTEGLQVLPYRQDRMVLATSVDHPLARFDSISFGDSLNFEFATLLDCSGWPDLLSQVARFEEKPLKICIQVGSFESLCRTIEANLGITVMPEFVLKRFSQTMRLHKIRLKNDWAVRDFKICVQKSKVLPVYANEFIKSLVTDGASADARKKRRPLIRTCA
jgi:DNA-binding transcriptional LysR family regulator